LAALAGALSIDVQDDRVLLDGEDVTAAIRAVEITRATRYAADNPGVRGRLVELQRRAVGDDNVVTEGRDQGTVVFPDAQCKVFLTATPLERARRRREDLVRRGSVQPLEEVLADQDERDRRDATRAVGPLIAAPDAVEICTDGLSADEVVDRLEALVRAAIHKRTKDDG
jgi:cytidylate kinase